MFQIEREGQTLHLSGRFDAAQERTALRAFDAMQGDVVVDMARLEYISSLGLGILMKTYQRLLEQGYTLTLRNLSKHLRDVFRYTSLDTVLHIE